MAGMFAHFHDLVKLGIRNILEVLAIPGIHGHGYNDALNNAEDLVPRDIGSEIH